MHAPTSPALRRAPLPSAADLAAMKAATRKAFEVAKRRNAAPATMLDKWMADCLLACDGAPGYAVAVMLGRNR